MAKFEYKKIQTVLGNNWHVVVDDDWQNRLRNKWAERGVHVF